ncbi:MAG: NADH-quinone oxidoreductase subunit J [Anaerovibrio sp.]|uniref:NADH-quinone oxidoreductase subunit J family protein n=1 Tax=Anaerovibrio sp. TaxID=1872532 RepID=UPI0025DD3C8B|nr:NADH-quinone oxidoreductase subunit J [Anaerovibrio sp.]MCR5176443.1 NADH-quinone oxidoreductase subunit J [Anaerovibrio sp.]
MSEILGTLVFYAVTVVILGTALGVVLSKNLVHSALLMTACFIGIGVLFIWLNADFLGAMEFMLYSGGVAILVVMGIMLTKRQDGAPGNPFNVRSLPALALVVLFLAIMFLVIMNSVVPAGEFISPDTVNGLADMMLNTYILPFEIAATLLLAALLGAIILAKGDGKA